MERDVRNCRSYYTRSACQDQDKRRRAAVLTAFASEVPGNYANVPLAFDR